MIFTTNMANINNRKCKHKAMLETYAWVSNSFLHILTEHLKKKKVKSTQKYKHDVINNVR